ncbi:hypothetical protein HJC23_004683 [Cyclotella cryptica]|uniref:Uncharacterized protein n=1 Tax=Cyclotella cryptica TaxID=29204 RepID=A0ABD3PK96_9STRA
MILQKLKQVQVRNEKIIRGVMHSASLNITKNSHDKQSTQGMKNYIPTRQNAPNSSRAAFMQSENT